MSNPPDQQNFGLIVLISAAVIVFLVALGNCNNDCEKRGGKLVRGVGCDSTYECVEPVHDKKGP